MSPTKSSPRNHRLNRNQYPSNDHNIPHLSRERYSSPKTCVHSSQSSSPPSFTQHEGMESQYLPVLVRAVREGRTDEVASLLARGTPIEQYGPLRRTPLHDAVELRHPELVLLLLQAGAGPNSMDTNDTRPLQIAYALQPVELEAFRHLRVYIRQSDAISTAALDHHEDRNQPAACSSRSSSPPPANTPSSTSTHTTSQDDECLLSSRSSTAMNASPTTTTDLHLAEDRNYSYDISWVHPSDFPPLGIGQGSPLLRPNWPNKSFNKLSERTARAIARLVQAAHARLEPLDVAAVQRQHAVVAALLQYGANPNCTATPASLFATEQRDLILHRALRVGDVQGKMGRRVTPPLPHVLYLCPTHPNTS